MRICLAPAFAAVIVLVLTGISYAGAIRPGFNANSLPANDDGSTGQIPIGLTVNFFGTNYTYLYVNNNGNVTFSGALSSYTPFPFGDLGRPIIAPFWGDVDTTVPGSSTTKYGTGTVDGRSAFGVTWVNVGYFAYTGQQTGKLNSFQLIIIDRSDREAGAFDLEFNYDKVLWETGDASGGTGGLGGASARAGYSDGTVNDFEILGSGVNGAFLDANQSDNFWVVYFQIAYQPEWFADRDPDTDHDLNPPPTTLGITPASSLVDVVPNNCSNMPIGGHGSFVFQEVIRDEFNVAGIGDNGLTAPHELGHQLGIDGDGPGQKIMSSLLDPEPLFIPEHLHLLRCRVKSPGQQP